MHLTAHRGRQYAKIELVCTAVRPYSCMGVQLYGCTAVWPYGCTAVRLYGRTAIRPYGRTTVQPYSLFRSHMGKQPAHVTPDTYDQA